MTVKRYQECSPLVKLWRRRHQLLIPFRAVYWWVWMRLHRGATPPDSFPVLWSISVGLSDNRMDWWYTIEEVFGEVPQAKD